MIGKVKLRKSKYISYTLRFAVAGAALYLAFRGENLKQIADVLLGLNLWILAGAIGFYILGQMVFVARWSLLLRIQSIRIGYWPAFRLHLLGLFYNNCLPGVVGGDLPRAWYVTHHTDKKLEAVLSVFVDRAIGLTGMLIMAFCCYWFIPTEGKQQRPQIYYNINLLPRIVEYKWPLLGIVVIVLIVFAAVVLSAKGRNLLRRSYVVLRHRGAEMLGRTRDAIRIYYSKKLALVCALLLTFCCQSIHVVAMWLIGREIGLSAHIKYYFVFFPISWLLGALPISVGGLGIMEGWLKVMFSRVCEVSSGHALVLALCQRLILLFASLPGVVIHLLGAHLPKDFSIDYNEPMN
ncbi:MAG: lysylphosphatidylglycerol synthase transmembrane domain-containing protein [Planctomycetota bacterium]